MHHTVRNHHNERQAIGSTKRLPCAHTELSELVEHAVSQDLTSALGKIVPGDDLYDESVVGRGFPLCSISTCVTGPAEHDATVAWKVCSRCFGTFGRLRAAACDVLVGVGRGVQLPVLGLLGVEVVC